ncbi:hypothetical protein SKAU_G00043990 [Synaphobranchus kaupii]|uniref:Uncharacterized protein n=1 Tax=Synaphobranchus kaupii TaxID=118154 RepID=A0A9Q1G1Q6_SYNKA|nr:hypothetical protein SKAU_G00043990 [Synaphobranchus kaupii]
MVARSPWQIECLPGHPLQQDCGSALNPMRAILGYKRSAAVCGSLRILGLQFKRDGPLAPRPPATHLADCGMKITGRSAARDSDDALALRHTSKRKEYPAAQG